LNESDVIEPPEYGWPTITPEALKGLGKDSVVIDLLRDLPYIRGGLDGPEIVPGTRIMDWRKLSLSKGTSAVADYKTFSEGYEYQDVIPSSVVGITFTGVFAKNFFLDTR
jgi:hypothetical protein